MIVKKTKQSKIGKRCKVILRESYALAREMSKKFGFEIGVSDLDFDGAERRKRKREEYIKRKSLEYHGMTFHLPKDEKKALNKTQLEVLYILENRSRQYYGETKIYNRRIAELINRSISTVEKAIKKLEQLQYISCYTTRYLRKGAIYSDRMIRCKRVWYDNQMKVAKENSWRHCRRPPKIVEGIHDNKGKKVPAEVIEPGYLNNYKSLSDFGFFSFDEPRLCYDYMIQRDEYGWTEPIDRIGYKRKTPPEFDWTVKPEDVCPPSHLKEGRVWPEIKGLELANFERVGVI